MLWNLVKRKYGCGLLSLGSNFLGKRVSLFIPAMRLLNKLVAASAIHLHGKHPDFQEKAELINN